MIRTTKKGSLFLLVLLLWGLGSVAHADTLATAGITFLGAPTGANDGLYYVLPYEISINQGAAPINYAATCYDTFDDVQGGQAWNANLFDLSEAAESGYF